MKKIQWFLGTLLFLTGMQATAQEMVKVKVPQKHEVGPSVMPKEIAPIKAPFAMPQLKKPVFPNREVSIVMTGAKQKGMSTKAIQKAIDLVNKQGGGTVIIPQGEWKTGRLILKSNVNLRLEKNAVLSFSGQVKDYLPVVFTRNEGVELYSLGSMIYAKDAENIAITGEGTLKGPGRGCEIDTLEKNGSFLDREMWKVPLKDRIYDGKKGTKFYRPTFVGFIHCKNILVEGITMTGTIFWNIVPEYCENVIIRGLTIDSFHTPRGDAMDMSSTKNVLIEYCWANTTDDAYTIKSGRGKDGLRVNIPTENVVIRHCYATHSAGGVAIGTEVAGGVRNVYTHDCVFEECSNGSYVKTRRTRGGGAENIYFDRIRLINCKTAFLWNMLGNRQWMGELGDRYPKNEPIPTESPCYKNMFFKDFIVESCGTLLKVTGTPEHPVENVVIENVDAKCQNTFILQDLKNFRLKNWRVQSEQCGYTSTGLESFSMENVEVTPIKNGERRR